MRESFYAAECNRVESHCCASYREDGDRARAPLTDNVRCGVNHVCLPIRRDRFRFVSLKIMNRGVEIN